MITRPDLVEAFERELMRSTPVDVERNLRIVEALYELARTVGAFPLRDPLAGIDVDIRWARAINAHRPT